MKYIIVEGIFPIVFTDALKHSDFKYAFQGKITSAGMCHIYNNKVHCYGESVISNLNQLQMMN